MSVPELLPDLLEAHEPPEARGLPRDRRPPARHRPGRPEPSSTAASRSCPDFSPPVTSSSSTPRPRFLRRWRPCARTEPSSSFGSRRRRRATIPTGSGSWSCARATSRSAAVEVGERLVLPAVRSAEILAPYAGLRLWLARLDLPRPPALYLAEHGHPIRYGYVPGRWPLSAYQNVYALEPGSAEMPSAGRPFTAELITRLVAGGILVAPITLHTGVSSQERHERPYPERFRVPAQTARLVNAVHAWGGRVSPPARPSSARSRPSRGRTARWRPARAGRTSSSRPSGASGRSTACSPACTSSESSHLDILRALLGERAARGELPRGDRARLPLARVRRQPARARRCPRTSLTLARRRRVRTIRPLVR